jgi:hypothetical protein
MPCDSGNNDTHSHDQARHLFGSGLRRKSTHPQSLLIAPDLTPNVLSLDVGAGPDVMAFFSSAIVAQHSAVHSRRYDCYHFNLIISEDMEVTPTSIASARCFLPHQVQGNHRHDALIASLYGCDELSLRTASTFNFPGQQYARSPGTVAAE